MQFDHNGRKHTANAFQSDGQWLVDIQRLSSNSVGVGTPVGEISVDGNLPKDEAVRIAVEQFREANAHSY